MNSGRRTPARSATPPRNGEVKRRWPSTPKPPAPTRDARPVAVAHDPERVVRGVDRARCHGGERGVREVVERPRHDRPPFIAAPRRGRRTGSRRPPPPAPSLADRPPRGAGAAARSRSKEAQERTALPASRRAAPTTRARKSRRGQHDDEQATGRAPRRRRRPSPRPLHAGETARPRHELVRGLDVRLGPRRSPGPGEPVRQRVDRSPRARAAAPAEREPSRTA